MKQSMINSFNGHTVPLVYHPLRDILEWSPAHIRNWVVGLGAEFHPIAAELYRQQVKGSDLLQIGEDKLISLGISNISHQEIILLALDLIRNISGIGGMSTLVISKSLSMHISDLMQHLWSGQNLSSAPDDSSQSSETEETTSLSVEVFEAIHSVLTDVYNLISVIEQYKQPDVPLEETLSCIASWKEKKALLLSQAETILNLLNYKESETRERVMSALKACSYLTETLAMLFNSFHHPPLSNHKSVYIIVPLVSIPGSKLGFNLRAYRDGKIRISEIVPNSPAAKSKLFHVGDEVIRVRDQMIVAWELSSIICLFSENQSSLSLTIKSRSSDAHHSIPPLPLSTGQNLDPSPNTFITTSSLTCLPSIVVNSDVNEFRTHSPLIRRLSLPSDERSRLNSYSDISPYKKPLRKRGSERAVVSVSDENYVPGLQEPPTPPPIRQAYRTVIVAGVVTRIPINPEFGKKTTAKKEKRRLWKSISFRRSEQHIDSLPKPRDMLSPLTESYQIKIINGIPHKFPARALVDAKKKEVGKGKKSKNKAHNKSDHLPVSHSLEAFTTPAELSLQNGYSERDLSSKQTASLSSCDALSPERANSPHLLGKFIHRVTSNGEVEVELISEINETPDMIAFENVPDELKVPCNSIRNPDCIGWLTKLGGSGLTPKNWRKRWFVLKGDKLYYYKSSFDFYALGKIYVPKYAIDIDTDVKKKHSFCLYHPLTRTYCMYADTEADAQKWILSLSKLSRPTFSTPARISSPSTDSVKDWKSKDSQISVD